MRMLKRLAFSFASIGFVLFALATYLDPQGFYALFETSKEIATGKAAELGDVADVEATPEDGDNPDWQMSEADLQKVIAPNFKLLPPDEASFDAGFLSYRDSFREAIAKRDLAAVLSFTGSDVLLSFGGEQGRDRFGELLEEPDIGESYWLQLEDVLGFASAPSQGSGYCAPYLSCAELPEEAGEIDPFETAFIVREDAPVYASASEDTPVIERLSYDAVLLGPYLNDPTWAEIVLADGRSGFVNRDAFRMMVGYRAQFEKIDGTWQMMVFVAGD